jgi:hypothetical protein
LRSSCLWLFYSKRSYHNRIIPVLQSSDNDANLTFLKVDSSRGRPFCGCTGRTWVARSTAGVSYSIACSPGSVSAVQRRLFAQLRLRDVIGIETRQVVSLHGRTVQFHLDIRAFTRRYDSLPPDSKRRKTRHWSSLYVYEHIRSIIY